MVFAEKAVSFWRGRGSVMGAAAGYATSAACNECRV